MKKYWFCEGVDEAWMTAEGDDGWQDTVRRYGDSGPYYLASAVDPREQQATAMIQAQRRKIEQLEKALRWYAEVECIELNTNAEIEEFQRVARDALRASNQSNGDRNG